MAALARRLGLFDATMLVMGGIVGSGIFMNPHVVARQVRTPALILGSWVLGGLIALAGAFIYAELAALRSEVGGQYAYLRDAFHPAAAFVYGWGLLLVTQSGGMAAVSVTFARYVLELTGFRAGETAVAVGTLGALTAINCLGVRAGATVQSALPGRAWTKLTRKARRHQAVMSSTAAQLSAMAPSCVRWIPRSVRMRARTGKAVTDMETPRKRAKAVNGTSEVERPG